MTLGIARALRELRSSPENPSTSLASPMAWMWEAFGATQTGSGISVSETVALRCATVYACVSRIAENLARCPCLMMSEDDVGVKTLALRQREYYLLRKKPNPDMNAFTFWEFMMASLLLWGNAYAVKAYDRSGRVVALWPKLPSKTKPVRDKNGILAFVSTDNQKGDHKEIAPEDMLHIPGLSLNGIQGVSPIAYNREAIALALATERYGGKLFSNGSRPPGILIPKNYLTPQQRDQLQLAWEQSLQGENAHRTKVMPIEMEYKSITMPNDDAQFLETRGLQDRHIARIYNVPAVLLHIDDKAATYASAEQFFLSFAKYTIAPWAKRVEMAIDASLFPEDEYFARFNMKELLRGDFKSRQDGNKTRWECGVITADEWREDDDLNPLEPGQGGGDIVRPLNTAVVGTEVNLPADDDPENIPVPSDTARAWFWDAATRVTRWSQRDAAKVERELRPVLMHMGRESAVPDVVQALMAGDVVTAEKIAFTEE